MRRREADDGAFVDGMTVQVRERAGLSHEDLLRRFAEPAPNQSASVRRAHPARRR
jgi:hypothetical protein